MQLLIIYLASIGASLFLFPLEWQLFLKRVDRSLERHRAQQELARVRQAWLFWASQTRRCLHRKTSVRRQMQTLAQALAYGEHYLQTATPSEEPRVYQLTQQLCQDLEQKLDQLLRSKKGGQAVVT
ncbi:MAG: hypothetical protein IT328_23410 [Caldilineaceae bacterium]|nr:hypothetical protein [Caldilineaceae bacterium]